MDRKKKRVIVTVSVLHIHGLPSNVSTAIDIKPTEDSSASRVPLARSFLASTLSLLVCFFFFFLGDFFLMHYFKVDGVFFPVLILGFVRVEFKVQGKEVWAQGKQVWAPRLQCRKY